MGRKKYSLLLWCILILILFRVENCLADETQKHSIEVVIMLDSSGSMNGFIDVENNRYEDKKIELAKEWAQQLCAVFINTDITVSIYTFEGINKEKAVIEKEKIEFENVKANINKLKEIEAQKNQPTDHYGALKKAEGYFNQDTSYQYIIMLSDGETDYGDNGTRMRYEPEAENDLDKEMTKGDAEKLFQDRCKEFAQKENHGIFLVDFGKEIKMFKELKEMKELKGNEKLNLFYIDYREPLSEVTDKLFEVLNMPLFLQQKSENENGDKRDRIDFEIEEDHYRTIINIVRKNNTNLDRLDETQIELYKKDTIINSADFNILSLANSAFIYLEPSEKGDYHIILPEDIWYYAIINQDNERITEVKLTLFQKGVPLKAKDNGDGIMEYNLQEVPRGLVLQAEFIRDKGGKYKSPDKITLINTSSEERSEDDWQKGKVYQPDSSDCWKKTLNIPKDNENNIYYVRVENGKDIIYSNNIRIMHKWIITEEKILNKNQEYNLEDTVPKEFVKDSNKIEFHVQDEAEHEKDTMRVGNIISFSKKDHYIVDITYESEWIGQIEFIVKGDDNIDSIFKIIVSIIAVMIIMLGVIVIVKGGVK